MILIDLQKAFDTLDHAILLQKMECLNFDPLVIKWFKSYLENRVFYLNPNPGRGGYFARAPL